MRYLILGAVLILTACIPVTIRPQFDDQGLPKATPVTVVGSQDLETGVFHPAFPVSAEAPTPPAKVPWDTLLQIALALAGVGGTGIAMRVAQRAKTAVKLVADLADAQESTSDPEILTRNKQLSAQMQEAAGVRTLIKKARGK